MRPFSIVWFLLVVVVISPRRPRPRRPDIALRIIVSSLSVLRLEDGKEQFFDHFSIDADNRIFLVVLLITVNWQQELKFNGAHFGRKGQVRLREPEGHQIGIRPGVAINHKREQSIHALMDMR